MRYMSDIRKKQNIINSKTIYHWLFLLVWMQHTVFFFVEAVIGRIPCFDTISSYIFPAIVILLILMSGQYFVKIIRPTDVIFFFIYFFVVLTSLMIVFKNAVYIEQELWRILGVAFPMFYLGIGYDHDDLKDGLYLLSFLGVCLVLLYQIYLLASGTVLHSDNMDTSYKTLPSIIYLIYWAYEKKKLIYWIPVCLGVILAFALGTRGAILVIAVFLIIGFLFYVIKLKSFVKKTICYVGIVLGFCILMSEDLIIKVAKIMTEQFGEIGFSTRVFDFLIGEEFMESNERKIIARKILSAIKEKPMLGYGIMGDRVVLNAKQGEYAHNIVLEILCDFGVVIGTLLLLLIVFVVISGIVKSKNSQRLFVIGLSLMVFIKLSLSGSFLIEPYLFLLLGICVSTVRGSKVKNRDKNDGVNNHENCTN